MRRLWGQNVISSTYYHRLGLGVNYEPRVGTQAWARITPGDSGAAWWQQYNGAYTITGVSSGIDRPMATTMASRVSRYTDWIKSIYSGALLFDGEVRTWTWRRNDSRSSGLYQYNNPYNGRTEFFSLQKRKPTQRYGYFPIDQGNNRHWAYVGEDKQAAIYLNAILSNYHRWG